MWIKQRFIIIWLFFTTSTLAGTKYYDGDNKPYEFAFKIEGNQHRQESKDINGIISGEFGFVTADGVYHQTVYGTDEYGNFRILGRKSYRLAATDSGISPAKRESQRKGKQIENQLLPEKSVSAPSISSSVNTLNADILLSEDLVNEAKAPELKLAQITTVAAPTKTSKSTLVLFNITSSSPITTISSSSITDNPKAEVNVEATVNSVPTITPATIVNPETTISLLNTTTILRNESTKIKQLHKKFIIPFIEILPPKESIHFKYEPIVQHQSKYIIDDSVTYNRELNSSVPTRTSKLNKIGQILNNISDIVVEGKNQVLTADEPLLISIKLPIPVIAKEQEIREIPTKLLEKPATISVKSPVNLQPASKINNKIVPKRESIENLLPATTISPDFVVTKLVEDETTPNPRPKAFIRSIEPTLPSTIIVEKTKDRSYRKPKKFVNILKPDSNSGITLPFTTNHEDHSENRSTILTIIPTTPASTQLLNNFKINSDTTQKLFNGSVTKILLDESIKLTPTLSRSSSSSSSLTIESVSQTPLSQDIVIIDLVPPDPIVTAAPFFAARTNEQELTISTTTTQRITPIVVTRKVNAVKKSKSYSDFSSNTKQLLPPGLEIVNMLYKFNYTAAFHGHNEHGNSNGMKKGGYFIVGRDNIKRTVTYVASKNGFVPSVRFGLVNPNDAPNLETEKEATIKNSEFKWFIENTKSKNSF